MHGDGAVLEAKSYLHGCVGHNVDNLAYTCSVRYKMTFDAPAIQATTAPIKVAIIEDLREVREGLAMLINGTSGFSCVGSFRSMETAIANLGDVNPDMILTDIGLPGMDGIAGQHPAKAGDAYFFRLNCTVGYYSAANVKSRILAVRSWYPGMVQIGAGH